MEPIDQDDDELEDEEDEEEIHMAQIAETDFRFSDFSGRLATPRVVSACASLLRDFLRNSAHTNHCALKMLHRVAWDCKCVSIMFQASLFRTFQQILRNDAPQYKELRKFAIFIIRKFTEVASSNSKIFMELLFWKNVRDAEEIEHGYAAYDDKPSKGKWSEAQEQELRTLYMENQQNPSTNMDVIDWILGNLIDQSRTRRVVIKKLKELGLIFHAPTKKSNVTGPRAPAQFGQEEDQILAELWEQFRSMDDPLSHIMPCMPLRRAKSRFVERLLELGLIADRKECRKKRSKSSRNHESGDEGTQSESEASDSDDQPPQSSRPTKPTKNKRPTKPSKPLRPTATTTAIAKALISAADKGFVSSLRWVAKCLEEVALDQEAEGFDPDADGIPLVPISEEDTVAMEDRLFQDTLQTIGIVAPADEQETYWRIPGSMHHETIRKRCQVILKAAEGTLVVPSQDEVNSNEKPSNTGRNGGDTSSEEDDDIFEKLRKIGHCDDATSAKVENATPKSQNAAKSQLAEAAGRKRLRSDSSDEVEVRNIKRNKQKKKQIFNEDYNNEDVLSTENNNSKRYNPLDEDSNSGHVPLSEVEDKSLAEKVSMEDEDILEFAQRNIQGHLEKTGDDVFDRLMNVGSVAVQDVDSDEDAPVQARSKKRIFIHDEDEDDN